MVFLSWGIGGGGGGGGGGGNESRGDYNNNRTVDIFKAQYYNAQKVRST